MKKFFKQMHESATKLPCTKVVVRYDVGFNNAVFIRGNAPGLSWEKGKMMKNAGPDMWVWETDAPFNECEFKVLINDQVYEEGGNHHLHSNKTAQVTPRFRKIA